MKEEITVFLCLVMLNLQINLKEQKAKTEIRGEGIRSITIVQCIVKERKPYDKPGDCPVCGMDLVEQPSVNKKIQYTCPMHPEIIKDDPGSCPNLRNGSCTT